MLRLLELAHGDTALADSLSGLLGKLQAIEGDADAHDARRR
jgi:hypothetical protein